MDNATIIIALITAIAAILAHLITSLINNAHQNKVKRIEINYNAKFNIYMEFCNAFGEFQATGNLHEYKNFLAATYKTLMMCDKKSAEEIIKLTKLYKDNLYQARDDFSKCVALLYVDLEKSKDENLLR